MKSQDKGTITEIEKAIDLNPNDADEYAFGKYIFNETKRFIKVIRRNPSLPV